MRQHALLGCSCGGTEGRRPWRAQRGEPAWAQSRGEAEAASTPSSTKRFTPAAGPTEGSWGAQKPSQPPGAQSRDTSGSTNCLGRRIQPLPGASQTPAWLCHCAGVLGSPPPPACSQRSRPGSPMPPGPSPWLERVGAGAGRPEGCSWTAGRGARGCEKGQPRGAPAKQVLAATILLTASQGRESHSCSLMGHLCEQHKGPFSPSHCYVISSLPGTGCADTLPSVVVREWFSRSWAWYRHPGLKSSLQFHCPRKGSGCAAQQAPGLPVMVQSGCSTSIMVEAQPKGSTVQLWGCREVQNGAGNSQRSLRRQPSRNGLETFKLQWIHGSRAGPLQGLRCPVGTQPAATVLRPREHEQSHSSPLGPRSPQRCNLQNSS